MGKKFCNLLGSLNTICEKILVGEKLAILANRELFAKIFLTNTHRYTKMYLAYALTVAYSPNFSLPIAFTYMVCQNLPPSPKFFLVRYVGNFVAVLLKLIVVSHCVLKLTVKIFAKLSKISSTLILQYFLNIVQD